MPATSTPRFQAFAAARLAEKGIGLRMAGDDDIPVIAAIYASTRAEELEPVPWTPDEKKAFTDWQSRQQEAHYALHYPHAERLLVEHEGPIGRIYIDTTPGEVRLMEVTLLPAFRNRGIGSLLMEALLAYADALGVPASLHVEPFNPAKRMYDRLGFVVMEARGIYEFMVRPPPDAPS
ncbi:MAG TPA: GNAT family N-acetyltransferase [Usitatibacter sp.]|nr:GNAT family N-acetyltransferase [Usitatibacter sp.]